MGKLMGTNGVTTASRADLARDLDDALGLLDGASGGRLRDVLRLVLGSVLQRHESGEQTRGVLAFASRIAEERDRLAVIGSRGTLTRARAADRISGADPGVHRKTRCRERVAGVEALASGGEELLALAEVAAHLRRGDASGARLSRHASQL